MFSTGADCAFRSEPVPAVVHCVTRLRDRHA
jgi:hypothetical protein